MSLSDFSTLILDEIEPPPRIGTRLETKFIQGMGKRDNRFVIILDIDKVFSEDELAVAQDMGMELAS